MASAFATFAADGIHRAPYLVAKVTAADGRLLYDHGAATGEQAVPQSVARNVTEAMTDVPSSSRIPLTGGRAQAGKTGTVQHPTLTTQNKDAWMVGFTPSVSTAVWVGTDASDPIKNAQGRPVYGRMLPGSIWQTYMNSALRGAPAEPFSSFSALGVAPGAALPDAADEDNSDGSDDESDKSDDDSDSKKDKKKRDRDSDGSSDGSGDGSGGDSGGSGGGGSDDGTAFRRELDPADGLGFPGLRDGDQPVARGASAT